MNEKAKQHLNFHLFPFQFSRTASGESLTVSRVYFRPRASDHQRAVTCRAENTNIRGSAIEDTIRVTVNCESLTQSISAVLLRSVWCSGRET